MKPKYEEEKITGRIYNQIVERAREIAEKTKGLINKDTLVVYLDKSGRLARVPLEEAWKEKGIKLPKKRYFLNFSSYKTKQGKLTREQEEAIKKIISKNKNAKNVLIIDTVSYKGKSIGMAKKEFEERTGKKVSTVTLLDVEGIVKKPFGKPDYTHSKKFNVKEGDVIALLEYVERPVKEQEGRIVRNEKGLAGYREFVKNFKKKMKQMRRTRRRR